MIVTHRIVRAVRITDFVLTLALAGIAGCASFMAWNAGKPHVFTPMCDGLDEEKCNPLRTSSSWCCDQHLNWNCNPFGTPADSTQPGRCEYSGPSQENQGDTTTNAPGSCGVPLGCEGARRPTDAGGDR